MAALSRCRPHYVRTIKPTETKQPQDWDAARVRHQVQYLGLLENVRVRRAGFCFRAPYQRFLNRYKKLSDKTWGTWGEWTGNDQDGCRMILAGTPLDDKQFQFGKTKLFIRHPESLFYLEESLERHDYECANIIQKAYRKYVAKKQALEQRRQAANLFRGKKERRRDSQNMKFECDYMHFDKNYQLQEALGQGREERLIFADQVVKFNRRLRPERRDLVITAEALYLCMRCKKNNQEYYKLTRRHDLRDVQSIILSTLQDNFFVLKFASDDLLLENARKTEIAAVMNEYYETKTGRKIQIDFMDSITVKLKTSDNRTITFRKDEGAPQPKLKKTAKTLTVGIATGLDKNTDTAPQAVSRPTGTGGGRGRATGGGGRGNVGGGNTQPSGGGNTQPVQQTPIQVQPVQMINPGGRGRAQPGAGAGPGRGTGGTGGNPPPPKPQEPQTPKAKAMYPYAGQTQDELSFKEGDVITIHKKDPGGWWEGELNGKRGWIPANYVQEI